jgi:malate synthase
MTSRIEITGDSGDRYDEILTGEALAFLGELHQRFERQRADLVALRAKHVQDFTVGHKRRLREETTVPRTHGDWKVAGAGPGLVDRRVEITGPTDRKMAINALNSSAKVWLADQEDATSPTWRNVVEGQLSLFDAIRGTLSFTSPEGKEYRVTNPTPPTIVMRPRGWHLPEKHLAFVDDDGSARDLSGSLVDFGLYFFHNAQRLIDGGRGPYFYLAKIESHQEAKLWDRVFSFAEEYLEIPHGTIRATVLIETIGAALQMDEILHALKDHCAGLNAGRWDYIFSIIKTFRGSGEWFLLPDRSQITMTVPFMRAYTQLLVQTAHRRGAYAIGGMSAFIPNRNDPEVTAAALDKVRIDKSREAEDGFDGTWVAHPGLIDTARAEFDRVLADDPNQVTRRRPVTGVSTRDLLDIRSAGGSVSDAGVRDNVSIAIRYIESWLRGIGAAAIDNLMEDAATAEISRSQIWQWIHQDTVTVDGSRVTREFVERIISELGLSGGRFDDATDVFRTVALRPEYPDFLTEVAYSKYLVATKTPQLVS